MSSQIGTMISHNIYKLSESVYRLGTLGNPRILSSYLIIDKKIAIIDCGPAIVIDELLKLAAECGVRASDIDYLMLTHIHIDHAGGAAKFLERCRKATAFVPEKGFKYMIDPSALNVSAHAVLGDQIFEYWKPCGALRKDKTSAVKPNEIIDLGSSELEYIPATGHAPHHNVIHDTRGEILFAADALGILDNQTSSIFPTTPPPSLNLPQSIRDIEMIREMSPEIACIAHYEELTPNQEFYDLLVRIFQTWAAAAEEYVSRKKLSSYGLEDYADIFSKLSEKFPQYQTIPDWLRQQVLRVDVAGLVNYFSKKREESRKLI